MHPFVPQLKPFVCGRFFASAPLLPSTVATSFNGNLFQNWETSLVTYGAKKHTKKTHAAAPETPPFRSEVANMKT